MVPDRVFAMKTVDFSMTVDFTMNDVLPTKIQKEAGLIRIHWSDGHESLHPYKSLRNACPCAGCKEEAHKPPNPFRILKPSEIAPLEVTQIDPVGRYAYRITWADGHNTGIFRLDYIRSLCQCPNCLPGKPG